MLDADLELTTTGTISEPFNQIGGGWFNFEKVLGVTPYTVDNPWSCAGDAADLCLCYLDINNDDKIAILTVEHKLVRPLITLIVNDTSNKLEGVRQPMAAMTYGSTETFDIDDLEDCV